MRLPAILDLAAARPLHDALTAQRGQQLDVDASAVERMGGLCLQVLIAAQRAWESDGRAFAITDASPAFESAVALMGGGEHMQARGTP